MSAAHQFSQEIKRSRFLACALPLGSEHEADGAIAACRQADAGHNCWAWRFGERYRSADDGEPAGTAGRPILAAIDGAGLDQVVVVVSRWFGGIKLGAGGLVRAYGGCAAECLRLAPKRHVEPRCQLQVHGDFDLLGPLYTLVGRHQATVLDEQHGAGGVSWRLELPCAELDALSTSLADASRGQARIISDEH